MTDQQPEPNEPETEPDDSTDDGVAAQPEPQTGVQDNFGDEATPTTAERAGG